MRPTLKERVGNGKVLNFVLRPLEIFRHDIP